MEIELAGKTALVTGGNIGIGAAISRALAECGAKVALTYYSHADEASETIQQIEAQGGRGFRLSLDATNSAQVTRCVHQGRDSIRRQHRHPGE